MPPTSPTANFDLTSRALQVDSLPRSSSSAIPMWPHSPPAHSRPDFELGRGRQVMGGVRCGICAGLPTSTRGNHMVRARGLVVLTVAIMVAVACGNTGGGGGGGSKGTIKIGSDFPVCTTGGQSTSNGVKFAVDQKNAAGGV